MARHTMMRPIRYALVAALLGALLAMMAGIVSAAVTITATPGTAVASPAGGNTFDILYSTIAVSLNVNCGDPTSPCSVWVARNNAPMATESLFANVTGSRANIPANFINDGCFNFRVYDSGHTLLAAALNVGHTHVCRADGTAAPHLSVFDTNIFGMGPSSGVRADTPAVALDMRWDSGFAAGVEDSQVWMTASKPDNPVFDCTQISYPNPNEVLYAHNVSGEKMDLNPTGGGVYCFALYIGTAHQIKLADTVQFYFTTSFLQYVGGTANPTAGKDNTKGTVYFFSGNGSVRGLVCVGGDSIPGPGLFNTVPFVYNSEGWNPGGTVATFQTAGAGALRYSLYANNVNRNPDGSPTNASCGSGTLLQTFIVTT